MASARTRETWRQARQLWSALSGRSVTQIRRLASAAVTGRKRWLDRRLAPTTHRPAATAASRTDVDPVPTRSGVIGEVTEYVRRTIVSAPSAVGSSAPLWGAERPEARRSASATNLDSCAGLQHVTGQVDRWLLQLYTNHRFRRSSDPVEAVHELRVASRRLRAFLDTFEPFLDPRAVARARKPLRKVTRALGELREWDVHANELSRLLSACQDEAQSAALEHLLQQVDQRRSGLRRAARRRLRGINVARIAPELRTALDQLAQHLARPGTAFETLAESALELAIDQVCNERPPLDGTEHVRQMHRLRIAVKRLRYAVELVKPALGEQYGELHRRAKSLQTLLGDHHDRVLLQHLVEAERQRLLQRDRLALARSLSPILGSITAARHELFTQFTRSLQPWSRAALKQRARTALQVAARA